MTPLEKASEAIYLLGPPDPDTDEPPARWFIPHVIAAIQALKDPDEGTLIAMDNADYECSEGISVSRMIGKEGMVNMFNAAIEYIGGAHVSI